MGSTYHPRNKKAKGNYGDYRFDVNLSGNQLLGFIMKAVDEHSLSVEANQKKYGFTEDERIPATRARMTADECRRAAKKLRGLTDEQVDALWKRCKFLFDKGSKVAKLKDFIEQWAGFLETSSGYRAT